MALVTCPDCGKQISDAAPACIHCGRPTASGVHKPNDKPIVIMGTGIPAVCAIINKLVDIAYNAPDKGPVVYVFVLDTRDQPKPDAATRYPLNGVSSDAMHYSADGVLRSRCGGSDESEGIRQRSAVVVQTSLASSQRPSAVQEVGKNGQLWRACIACGDPAPSVLIQ